MVKEMRTKLQKWRDGIEWSWWVIVGIFLIPVIAGLIVRSMS